MIVSFQSDEHNQAVNFSISQIAMFVNTVSMILNFQLYFPMKYKYSYFQVKDFSGAKLCMNIFEPYECENALIYLYENFRTLQQHSGVDFSKVKGVFDVRSLIESPFLGKFFEIPSIEVVANEVGKNKEDEVEDWEILDDED
jgi:hypothetical protein